MPMAYDLLNEKIDEVRKLNLNYVNHYNFALCDCGSIIHKKYVYKHILCRQHLKRIDVNNNNNIYALCVCGDIIRKEYMNEHKNIVRHLKGMGEMNNKIDLKALAYNKKQDINEIIIKFKINIQIKNNFSFSKSNFKTFYMIIQVIYL